MEQLKSLTAQVSALTRLTAVNPKWLLVDVLDVNWKSFWIKL